MTCHQLESRLEPYVDGELGARELYGKGYTLLSVLVVPLAGEESPAGRLVRYRGADYSLDERKGYRTVTWTEARTLFSLVSVVDYEALLECADRLRRERPTARRRDWSRVGVQMGVRSAAHPRAARHARRPVASVLGFAAAAAR